MSAPTFALSLKQPWAALLAHGLKTIEVRRWPTARLGRILIHAARVPDERPEAWVHVPESVRPAARLLGGIVGAGDLLKCVAYRSLDDFAADQPRHLNELSWFEEPVLYGFIFANLEVLPFRRYPGWMRFFPVGDDLPGRTHPAADGAWSPVMMRRGWNPTRRNRNIGTARAGYGQDNRLVIPSSRRDLRPYWSRLGPHTTVTRTVVGRTVTILVEPVRESSVHACTVDDLCYLLEQIPGGDWRWSLEFFILRQPKRKEQTLRSVWGRLAYGLEVGSYRGPAVILEAVDLSRPRRWPKSLGPDDDAELERLRADGHRITTTRHAHVVHSDLAASRATQLYRTLPHEIGHWVDFRQKVVLAPDLTQSYDERWERYFQRPAVERETFAHRYAEEIGARLRAWGAIPFERRFDADGLHRDGLQPRDFTAPSERRAAAGKPLAPVLRREGMG